jgi:group I intron endonuclease
MMGIYAIENVVTGECYVGQSKNIINRFQQHLSMLEKGEHHSIKLQKAYDNLGIDKFTFKILELCDESILNVKEQEWINKLDSINRGYNMKSTDEFRAQQLQSRASDILYKQFKEYCNDLGLTVAEAINIIIDRELEESQKSITLLKSIKETLSNSIVVEEEEIKRTVRRMRVNGEKPKLEHAIQCAKRLIKENKSFTVRDLAKIADCAVSTAHTAIKEAEAIMKKDK